VPTGEKPFETRINLPAAWRGLRDEELAVVCGVKDAVFCHNGLFIGGAKTKDGAIEMARVAIECAHPVVA
jgi:uncharacterized UPF0160 family protein